MKPEAILQSDVLDIIFEHRNKDYGACELRSQYGNRLIKSLSIIFSVFFSVIGLTILNNHLFPAISKRYVSVDLPISELSKIQEQKAVLRPNVKSITHRAAVQHPESKPFL